MPDRICRRLAPKLKGRLSRKDWHFRVRRLLSPRAPGAAGRVAIASAAPQNGAGFRLAASAFASCGHAVAWALGAYAVRAPRDVMATRKLTALIDSR
jgi:hypothetical protein